jgi:hypothetical protein
LIRQIVQNVGVDRVHAESGLILPKAKAPEPVAYIDRAPAGHGA